MWRIHAVRNDPPLETTSVILGDLLSHFLPGDAAVDGHEVHPVLGVLLDAVEDVVLGHLDDGVPPCGGESGLVDRDGTHHHGAFAQEPGPDGVDVPSGAEVHHGVGAVPQRDLQLLELRVQVDDVPGCAEVDIDLDGQPLAYRGRFGVVDGVVGRADASGCDAPADELGADALPLGNAPHQRGDLPPAGGLHDGAHLESALRIVPSALIVMGCGRTFHASSSAGPISSFLYSHARVRSHAHARII